MNYRVVMMACERTPNYAPGSLRSLFGNDRRLEAIDIVVDGDDAEFLGKWGRDKRVTVHLLDSETHATKLRHYSRVSRTLHRCLKIVEPDEALVLLQDDVEAAPDWLKSTLAGADRAEGELAATSSFVLQLFAGWRLRDTPLHHLTADQYYSNVGVFFPAALLERLIPFVEKEGYDELIDDMLVKKFLESSGDELFVLNPNVIQHVGSRDSTHDARPTTSPSFTPMPERPAFRVYGVSKGHGSFARITAGARLGFGKLERAGDFVALDDLERQAADGVRHPCAIMLGPPGFVGCMTSYGDHRRAFAVLAPNSEWLPRRLIERLDGHAEIIAPSHWGARVLERYTGRLLPPYQHGVDPAFSLQAVDPVDAAGDALVQGALAEVHAQGHFRVLHLSSTDRERKGTQQLLDAWVRLVDGGVFSGVLTAVVDAPAGTFGKAEEHGSITLVRRHLNMDPAEMAAAYRSYHVLCQPSRSEGFGLCPVEARACGTVLCATACTGHGDHIHLDDPGVVVVAHGLKAPIDDSYEPEALAPTVETGAVADALEYCHANWERLHAEAQEAAPDFSEQWSWPNVTQRWLKEMDLW